MAKTKEPLIILVDADALVFEVTAACQEEFEWSPDVWTYNCDTAEAKRKFIDRLDTIVKRVTTLLKQKEHKIIMCFSDSINFRKQVYPQYKANRVGKRKPLGYLAVKQWVSQEYETKVFPECEGDDALGILHTSLGNTVICSIDKDMLTLGGLYYDYGHDELHRTTSEDGFYRHMLQTLTGDVTDGYPGCPGIGKVTAAKILDKECSWQTIVKTYESKGLTEDDALIQARVAKILTSDLWSSDSGVKLWNPYE